MLQEKTLVLMDHRVGFHDQPQHQNAWNADRLDRWDNVESMSSDPVGISPRQSPVITHPGAAKVTPVSTVLATHSRRRGLW